MTIKEAFQKLAISLSASMKNPFFINRRLYQDFADIADKIEEGSGDVDASDVSYGETTVEDALDVLNAGHVYSTTAKKVGKWVDGTTDVYEKTIILSEGFSVSSNQKVDLAVIENIMPISMQMTILESGTWYMCPDPSLRLNYVESSGKIQGDAKSSWNVSTAYLVVRYLEVSV